MTHIALPEGIVPGTPPADYGTALAPLPPEVSRFEPDQAMLDLPLGGTVGFFAPNRVSRHFMVAGFCDLRFDLNGRVLGLRYADLCAHLNRPVHPDLVDTYSGGIVRADEIYLWNFWGFRLSLSHALMPLALDFTK